MIINAEILLCKLNIVSSIYRDFPIWILFRRQETAPKAVVAALGREERNRIYLLLR